MPAYLSRYSADVTLPAATPVTVDVPVDGARDWLFVLKNTGPTNAITALTVARYPLGVAEIGEAPVAASTGLPLAAAGLLAIEGASEPVTTLRLVITSTAGTTARIAGGGW